jgi:hypothetical protein
MGNAMRKIGHCVDICGDISVASPSDFLAWGKMKTLLFSKFNFKRISEAKRVGGRTTPRQYKKFLIHFCYFQNDGNIIFLHNLSMLVLLLKE